MEVLVADWKVRFEKQVWHTEYQAKCGISWCSSAGVCHFSLTFSNKKQVLKSTMYK